METGFPVHTSQTMQWIRGWNGVSQSVFEGRIQFRIFLNLLVVLSVILSVILSVVLSHLIRIHTRLPTQSVVDERVDLRSRHGESGCCGRGTVGVMKRVITRPCDIACWCGWNELEIEETDEEETREFEESEVGVVEGEDVVERVDEESEQDVTGISLPQTGPSDTLTRTRPVDLEVGASGRFGVKDELSEDETFQSIHSPCLGRQDDLDQRDEDWFQKEDIKRLTLYLNQIWMEWSRVHTGQVVDHLVDYLHDLGDNLHPLACGRSECPGRRVRVTGVNDPTVGGFNLVERGDISRRREGVEIHSCNTVGAFPSSGMRVEQSPIPGKQERPEQGDIEQCMVWQTVR